MADCSRLGDWFCALDGGDRSPFVTGTEELAARLGDQSCLIVGHGVSSLASSLAAAGIDATVCEAPPDPAILGRLALARGADTWRTCNRREGLPRPLYLRGVNITLPDGARRTVE